MSNFYNKLKTGKGFPIGSIIPWSGNVNDIPAGWISCSSGLTLRVSDYPALYENIGNIYGGTSGQTFRLPNLNDGVSGAVDIFRGHFTYLNNLKNTIPDYVAHAPEKTNINDDLFWQNVGQSNNGNSAGTNQTQWVSTIDLVGNFITRNINNLTAVYSSFEFVSGEFVQTLIPSGRRLSDIHIPSHTHGAEFGDENVGNAYSQGSRRAQSCNNGRRISTSTFCELIPTCTLVTRPIPGKNTGGPITGDQMASMGPRQSPVVGDPRIGGGGLIDTSPTRGQDSSVSYESNDGGDGRGGGHMVPGSSTYFFTSLSPSAGFSIVREFAGVAEHFHGSLTYTFSSKYIRVLNPALVQDVRLNQVDIINDTGRNFGTISANTATATLSMIFIIKAF